MCGDFLIIKEVPKLHLSKLGTAEYSIDEKASDKNKYSRIEARFRVLSPEKKSQILEKLLNQKNKI